MNCEQFEDNIGAYALGALPEAEMREAEDHLQSCARHPEAVEFQRVGVALATSAPEMDPPPALKSRLMEAIRADAQPSAGPMQAVKWSREEGERTGLLARIGSWFTGPQRGYALAGALGVVVAALLVWNVSLQNDDGASGSDPSVVTLSGSATGQVIYLEDQKIAVMDLHDVAPPPADHVYQVWAISDGQPASLGFLEVAEGGEATAAMSNISLDGVDQIAVTVEPTPGSQQPTSDPVIIGDV